MATRPATFADAPLLAALSESMDELHRAAHPELFRAPGEPFRDPGWFERALADERSSYLVAERDDGSSTVVGYARLVVVETPDGRPLAPRRFAQVDELCVAEPARRRGVASELLRAAEAWAKERGLGALEVTVWTFNRGARALYEKHGYGELRSYLRKVL